MSAPQIPNLLSLRGRGGRGRGGRGGRGGGGGNDGNSGALPGSSSSSSPSSGPSHDTTIQGTDTDASVSRLSAVRLGYLDDPYAQYFVQQAGFPAPRRLPIINRGTYTRTTALDHLISAFLADGDNVDAGETKQIVSLGAGTDTRWFRMLSPSSKARRVGSVVYHEIDFPTIAAKKLQTVQATPVLRQLLPRSEKCEGATEATESNSWSCRDLPDGCEYWCHGLDLRDLLKTADILNLLPGLRSDVPTLLISECCLCYLKPAQAKGVIGHFAKAIPNLATVIYEPIKPHDPFGRQMVANLAARRIHMPTFEVYRTVADQESRLREAGFGDGVKAATIEDIWRTWVSPAEKERLDELEGLDEVEEWILLAGHYVVAWGWRGKGFEGWKGII